MNNTKRCADKFSRAADPAKRLEIILRLAFIPDITLAEVGFINSDKDNNIFVNQFDETVNAITQGIINAIPLYKPEQKQYSVQVGLFRHYANAEFLRGQLEDLGYDVSIRNDPPYYTVVVGRENSLEDAADLQYQLRQAGYDTLIIAV